MIGDFTPKKELQLWEVGDDTHWGWLCSIKKPDAKESLCKNPYQQRCSDTITWMILLFHAKDILLETGIVGPNHPFNPPKKKHSFLDLPLWPAEQPEISWARWPMFIPFFSSIFLLPKGKLWRAMVDHSGQWWVFDGLCPWHLSSVKKSLLVFFSWWVDRFVLFMIIYCPCVSIGIIMKSANSGPPTNINIPCN